MDTQGIAGKFADFAISTNYDDLPVDIVWAAKRFLLDSLGCALRGTLCNDSAILLEAVRELGGVPECTVIGQRSRTNCYLAALANSYLTRVLDYNDIYWAQDPSHPSDLISAALAIGEKERRSGRDLITAIVVAYELEMRLCEFGIPGIEERGWHHASLTQFVSPVVAGKMMNLNAREIRNAIGISGCHNFTLGAITAGGLTNMKNAADPFATQSGVMAALLARRGFSGPESVVDGHNGIMDALDGQWDLDRLEGDGTFKIGQCSMKAFPTEALTHSPITATMKLVRDHDLRSSEILEITVRTVRRAVQILADPSKYQPETKETADHSLPYCIAVAITDRTVSLDQFSDFRLKNKEVMGLAKKVRVVADNDLEKAYPRTKPAIVEILTKDKKKYAMRVDHPKGDPRNQMSQEELIAKFKSNAAPVISEERQSQILDMTMRLEELREIGDLMLLLKEE